MNSHTAKNIFIVFFSHLLIEIYSLALVYIMSVSKTIGILYGCESVMSSYNLTNYVININLNELVKIRFLQTFP